MENVIKVLVAGLLLYLAGLLFMILMS